MADIHSMTGFSRLEGSADNAAWTWEIKSVNGRNLDMRIRVPYGFDRIDPQIRKLVSAHLVRGSVTINLSVRSEASPSRVRVNIDSLDVVVRSLAELQNRQDIDTDKARPEGILALRGVLEQAEEANQDVDEPILIGLMTGFESALLELKGARRTEGEFLRPLLMQQIDTIQDLADRAGCVPGHQPQAIRDRLWEQIEAVLEDHKSLDPARLNQEIAILVTKADIREEIDRLKAHCQTAADLLLKGGPVGRRLDHLCQEFNREANTLCSKSNDVEMTGIGLDLKAVIDQFREQIQNLE